MARSLGFLAAVAFFSSLSALAAEPIYPADKGKAKLMKLSVKADLCSIKLDPDAAEWIATMLSDISPVSMEAARAEENEWLLVMQDLGTTRVESCIDLRNDLRREGFVQ